MKRKTARENNWKVLGIDITEEAYLAILGEQDFRCAICGRDEKEYRRGLAVDQNHATGQIRGLLCVKCNVGIGSFCEDITLLKKAKDYLVHHRTQAILDNQD